MNCMIFTVWNRPEMFKLCLDSVVEAREHHDLQNFHTVFGVEHGAPPIIREIISKDYPFSYEVLVRKQPFGLTRNILETMKYAMTKADDFVMFQGDDVMLHKTFYEYMDIVMNMDVGNVSTYYGGGSDVDGDIRKIKKRKHYDAMGSMITKGFFEKYILPHAKEEYYRNRSSYLVQNLDMKHKDDKRYKFHHCVGKYNEQAGLINRVIDLARIEDDKWIIGPEVDRCRDIGFYGKNRSGTLPGNSFEERLENLRQIVTDVEKMKAQTPHYHHYYKLFNSELDNWDGTLFLEKK